MSTISPLSIYTIWSFRRELKLVIATFLIVLSIPIVAVILLTNVGINIISDKLTDVDPQTNTVNILHPTTGEIVTTINAAIVWPTKGTITLEFGESSIYQPLHTGIDIAGNIGDQITPFMDGKVIYAGEIFWGYGKHIIIDHGNNLTSIYAHLDKIYVIPGQQVSTSYVIGLEGSTGWSTGPHLHFQTNVYGIPVNPRVFLPSI